MTRLGLLPLLVLLAPLAAALDLGVDLAASSVDGPLFRRTTGPYPTLGLSVGQDLGIAYANLELEVGTSKSAGRLTLSASGDLGSVGLQALASAQATGLRPEVGAFASFSLPLVGDLVLLEASLQARTDFQGAFAELKLAPTAYLPLWSGLIVGPVFTQDFVTAGYDGQTATGLSTFAAKVQATVVWTTSWSTAFEAGWAQDVSGGLLALGDGEPSYAFGSAKVSWSYGN